MPAYPGKPPLDLDVFVEAVLSTVERIPSGRVTTYGAIAEHVGGGGPRRVGKVMSTHGDLVPWWRVVRADGSPPPCHGQTSGEHYGLEGTPVRPSGRIDMPAAYWQPDRPD